MKRIFLFYLFFSLNFLFGSSFATQYYFLCGPDEDGCYSDIYPYCLCMPYDNGIASKPYCLDLNNVSCLPLSERPNCPRGYIMKNQASCLATAFQSEPDPPCPLTTKKFCVTHHIPICKKDGGEDNCQ